MIEVKRAVDFPRISPALGVMKAQRVLLLLAIVAIHILIFLLAIYGKNQQTLEVQPPVLISAHLISAEKPQSQPQQKQPISKPVAQKKVVLLPKSTPVAPIAKPQTSSSHTAEPSKTASQIPPAENTAVSPAAASTSIEAPHLDHALRLENAETPYPAASLRLGEKGTVVLRIYILANGSVGEVQLEATSGYSRLDNAAIQAVKRWHFIPAKQGGQPIAYWYVQPVFFDLKKE